MQFLREILTHEIKNNFYWLIIKIFKPSKNANSIDTEMLLSLRNVE